MNKKNLKPLIGFFITAAIAICCVLSVGSKERLTSINLYADRNVALVNDTEFQISSVPILYKYNAYVPMDDILTLCGYTLGWDADSGSTVAVRNNDTDYIVLGDYRGVLWVNDERYEKLPPIEYNGITFISLDMLSYMTDDSIYIDGTPTLIKKDLRDTLDDTVVYDTYRKEGAGISTYGGITFVGTDGMELLSISANSARDYANVVNAVADALPSVHTYNIAVPTACEFYAPKSLYTNQVNGIRTIYQNLNQNVTPINVVKPLMEHANEFIYFTTDHHWTQRGAYYGYREFCENKGSSIPPIWEYECVRYPYHIGSFASFTRGTQGEKIVRSHPDMLEKFIQKYSDNGMAYNDQYMRSPKYPLSLVNTKYTNYMAFIGGDNPLAVFTTGNQNGKSLVVIKESFGTAFASWAANDYQYIYVIDPRKFNGFDGNYQPFNLISFYEFTHFDDLVIINYPGSISSGRYKSSILKMIGR